MDGHTDLKRLRRETREEALRIAMPVAIPAIILLLAMALFYFLPPSGFLPVLKGNYGQIHGYDKTWIFCWMIAAPLTGAAIGVYKAAFNILLRTKTGLGSVQQQTHSSGRKGHQGPADRYGGQFRSNAVN